MKTILLLFKILISFLVLPFEISKGSKRRAYRKIKGMMAATNIF